MLVNPDLNIIRFNLYRIRPDSVDFEYTFFHAYRDLTAFRDLFSKKIFT